MNKGNNKITELEQSYKGKVKTHKYINRQKSVNNRKTPWLGTGISKEMVGWIRF